MKFSTVFALGIAFVMMLTGAADANWEILDGASEVVDIAGGGVPLGDLGSARCGVLGQVDSDGVLDLVTGHASGSGGALVVYSGNEEFRQGIRRDLWRARQGLSPVPAFRDHAVRYSLPFAPDWIALGDFDADGHPDIVCAARGRAELAVLDGDGSGRFGRPRLKPIPGPVTAFAAGEVDRPDSLDDLVIAIDVGTGGALLVFEGPEGALRAKPEWQYLTDPVTDLALGRFDDDPWVDIAVAADDVVVFFGRDRRLTETAARQERVTPARVQTLGLPSPAFDLVFGHFTDESYRQLAVRRVDGRLDFLEATDGRIVRMAMDTLQGPFPAEGTLVAARFMGRPGYDLLVSDPDGKSLVAYGVSEAKAGGILLETCETIPAGDSKVVLVGRLNRDARDDLVLLGGSSLPLIVKTTPATVFTVNSTADTDDGSCDPTDCTLREAIRALNGAPLASSIVMDLGIGATISPESSFFVITANGAEIDGTVGSGFLTSWLTLDGSSCTDCPGSVLAGNAISLSRMSIGGFINGPTQTVQSGIHITGDANLVEDCIIGLDLANNPTPNNIGIWIDRSDDNTIGGSTSSARNVISSNEKQGVRLFSLASAPKGTGNRIIGNYIGTDRLAAAPAGNTLAGVESTMAGSNYIGTALPGEGNVISGNGGSGVLLELETGNPDSAHYVLHNLIGVAGDGVTSMANGDTALKILNQRNTTIGNSGGGPRNVVAATSDLTAIEVAGDSSGTTISGNYVSIGSDGRTALPSYQGIMVSSSLVTIGGTTRPYGNLVGGNTAQGITVGSRYSSISDIDVVGNVVGTDVDQQVALSNNREAVGLWNCSDCTVGDVAHTESGNVIVGAGGYSSYGLGIFNCQDVEVAHNRIGLTDADLPLGNAGNGLVVSGNTCRVSANVIAYNGLEGVAIRGNGDNDSMGITVTRNSIHSNGELGLTLVGGGVTYNDPGDTDTGNNNRQNFPIITGHDAETGIVTATLDSNRANSTYTIELYESRACDPLGYGEGETFLSEATVVSDDAGDSAISITAVVTPGAFLTMLATDRDGNTSEFSPCFHSEDPNLIFADGFETGSTNAWSAAVP